MGDRYDREQMLRRRRNGGAIKPPELYLTWGLPKVQAPAEPAGIGHNGGPPIEGEAPGYLWRRSRWTAAHREAWKAPSMGVLKFRLARAQAAGVTYEEYMRELLDTGRHLQAADVGRRSREGGFGGDK